jgi:branched-chain amino acid transport system ATP-binding protein
MNAPASPVLELKDLHSYYGNIQALKGVSIDLNAGEVVALIGSNGAGKTTTLAAASLVHRPRSGTIRLKGEDVTDVPPQDLVRRGMAHVPEGRAIFKEMSVLENLEVGGYLLNDKGLRAERVEAGLELFPRLRERAAQMAGNLSGGEQQMLAMARALMTDPDVILLDEPSMGLSPKYVEFVFEIVERLHAAGKSILLVEQNAEMALGVADRGYVLQTGEVVLSGPAGELAGSDRVREIYFGE